MNAEQLLALFDRVAEAPDAIPRLRRFVLDLAVRGKLVEQDPAEESLWDGLQRTDFVCTADGLYRLPDCWDWVDVASVAQSRLGKMLDKARNQGRLRPYLRNINVRWFGFDLSDLKEMPFLDSEVDEYRLRVGDVLICEGGEPGRAAVWDGRRHDVYFQKAIHRVRFHQLVNPHYFVITLKASAEDGRLAERFTGTGIKHLTGRGLGGYRFPLPPLAEQRRIVARVEELMGLLDRLEAGRVQRDTTRERLTTTSLGRLTSPRTIEVRNAEYARFALDALSAFTGHADLIKSLRQAILDLAMQGRLVDQDPADEPAGELLKRISLARGLRGPVPAAPDTRNTTPFDLPSSWQMSSLGHLTMVTDPNPSHRYPEYADGSVPILSTREFSGEDGWNPETAKLTTEAFWEFQKTLCDFADGDIVFARKGRLGLPRYLPRLERFTFSHTLFVIKPMPGLEPAFLLWHLRRDSVIRWLTEEMNQNTGVPTLGKGKTERLPVALPPLAEQQRIVAKVDALMDLCDRLDAALSSTDTTKQRLLKSLLREALSESETWTPCFGQSLALA